MSEQTYLCNVKLGKKNFGIFVNKYHRKSFLEILKDGSFCYPLAEDYIKLDEIYNKRKFEGIYLSKAARFFPSKAEFVPKCIKNGQTVPAIILAAGLLLAGCNPPVLTNLQVQQLKELGIETEETNGNAIVTKKDGIIYTKNNDEFRKYIENKNPTFDDCRKMLESNNNFTEEYKRFFANYIDSLEKTYPDFDLVLLNNFMKDGNVEIVSEEELRNRIGGNSTAFFNFLKNTIVTTITNPDKADKADRETLTHETVHASTAGSTRNDEDETVVRFFEMQNVEPVENPENPEIQLVTINYTGLGVLEAATDIITAEILKTPIILDEYIEEVDELKLLLERLDSNSTVPQILEGNVLDLINELEESGIDNPNFFIDCIDVSACGNENSENQNTMRWNFYIEYFRDLTQEMIDNGKKTEEIYSTVTEILDNSIYVYQQDELNNSVLDTVNATLTLNGITDTIHIFPGQIGKQVETGEEIEIEI